MCQRVVVVKAHRTSVNLLPRAGRPHADSREGESGRSAAAAPSASPRPPSSPLARASWPLLRRSSWISQKGRDFFTSLRPLLEGDKGRPAASDCCCCCGGAGVAGAGVAGAGGASATLGAPAFMNDSQPPSSCLLTGAGVAAADDVVAAGADAVVAAGKVAPVVGSSGAVVGVHGAGVLVRDKREGLP